MEFRHITYLILRFSLYYCMTRMYFSHPKRRLKLTAFCRVRNSDACNELDVHTLHNAHPSATSFGDENAPTGPVAFQEFDNM
jgi:hypothetical protein